ncbi:MAG: DNA polymerase III subunit beta [Gammaproteobacteria bacterium]|nr:DNA polymerase III subunit beta [Gammaproteobacteria bacterium]
MKFTIDREALLKSISHAQSIVERRNTIPILANVLLRAEENGLVEITATDMDIGIIEKVPAGVAQAGAVTVSAHTLFEIVRKLEDGAQIELGGASESGQIELRSGRSSLKLSTLPSEDFPTVSQEDLPTEFFISADLLRSLIDRTRFAISTEETRYYLNGIYLHAAVGLKGQVLRSVATDGHRLALMEIPLPSEAENMPGVIVPRKTVNELRKLLDEVTGEVLIKLSETRIQFAVDGIDLSSKLIDGTFPDYDRVIPDGNEKVMIVDRKRFERAVDLVSTISNEKSRAIKLTLSDNSLVLSATSPESGSATEELEAKYPDDKLEIGFNSRYLIDITQQINGDFARFELSDGASPTVMREVEESDALYVLMPMRV